MRNEVFVMSKTVERPGMEANSSSCSCHSLIDSQKALELFDVYPKDVPAIGPSACAQTDVDKTRA